MSRRKIVFVIVEGPSDDEALALSLSKIFDKDSVYVHVVHGDITSKGGVTPENIESKITEIVREYANSSRFKRTDFREVIHIADTDGAFIPEDRIVEDKTLRKIQYSTFEIRAVSRDSIVARNRQKQANINALVKFKTVWKTVTYSIYYMSCNLDHVLHNRLNCTSNEKERNAISFARKYKDNTYAFTNYIARSGFSVTDGYIESWNFIRKDTRSLERYTNLGIRLLKEYKNKK